MKALLAAVTAAALAPALAQAQESRLAEPFRTLCMAAHGKADVTTAAARSAGFVAPPAVMLQDLTGAIPDAIRPVVLWKTYDGGLTMALIGEMPAPGTPPMSAEVCGIATIPSEPTPSATLETILGVGQPLKNGSTDMFIYDEGPDGRRAAVDVRDSGEVRKLLEEGRLRMAMAGVTKAHDFDISIVMLLAPHAVNTAALDRRLAAR